MRRRLDDRVNSARRSLALRNLDFRFRLNTASAWPIKRRDPGPGVVAKRRDRSGQYRSDEISRARESRSLAAPSTWADRCKFLQTRIATLMALIDVPARLPRELPDNALRQSPNSGPICSPRSEKCGYSLFFSLLAEKAALHRRQTKTYHVDI